jgi:rhodanese-related sulfurtransferase/rubrerythrin
MFDAEFKDMTVEELRQFIETKNEKDYTIVDVRQPAEYTDGHIPGAKFIPLNDLVSDFSGLPRNKDVVFYCHSGSRSAAAAAMAADEMTSSRDIYNLAGGIMAWGGQTVKGFPKVQVFDPSGPESKLLLTAMNLEKGAWQFYRHVSAHFGLASMTSTLEKLSKAEIGHAKIVYGFWKTITEQVSPFEALYDDLAGDIMEGGESVVDVLDALKNVDDRRCLAVMELALHIEYTAFDLYRTMAEQTAGAAAREAFITLAQAEKNHMRMLARELDQCK